MPGQAGGGNNKNIKPRLLKQKLPRGCRAASGALQKQFLDVSVIWGLLLLASRFLWHLLLLAALVLRFLSHLISSYLISSHLTSPHLIPCLPSSSDLISSHLISVLQNASLLISALLSSSQLFSVSVFLSISQLSSFLVQNLLENRISVPKAKKKILIFFKTILKGKGTCQKRGEKNQEKLNVATLAQPRHSDLQAPSCKRQ